VVLAAYADQFPKVFPEVCRLGRVVWVPHSASPDFLIPWNAQAENSVFISGQVNHHYPFRQQMKSLYETGHYAMAYHPHPGYHCGYDYQNDSRVGIGYARSLNRYRAAFTDSSRYRYLVAKFFEIPATGALLLADSAASPILREFGFFENEHYIAVSAGDIDAQLRYVLDERNHSDLDAVRKRGQAIVWERHKTSDRARLIDEACGR
jgi:hypothetical protein